MFGQGKFRGSPAYFLRVQDFVSAPVLQNAVLVNAGTVGKGVRPHYGLGTRNGQAAHGGHHAAGAHQFIRSYSGPHFGKEIPPGMQRHNDFLQGGISGPFPDAVDGSLYLLRPGPDGRQRVGHGHPHVIMAMDGQPDAAHIGNM